MLAIVLLCVAACRPTRSPELATPAQPATASESNLNPAALSAAATSTSPVLSTANSEPFAFLPTAEASRAATSTTIPVTSTSSNGRSLVLYEVAFVDADDRLNVRAGPGVSNEVVGRLDPGATDVSILGVGQHTNGSLWVPVARGNTQGWVNSRYLTGQLSVGDFCNNATVHEILTAFVSAVAAEDSTRLVSLVHPERGLRVRISWSNPEVRLVGADLEQIFTSQQVHDWGKEDGSGLPVGGTFRDIILPLLTHDLVSANDFACAKLLHGPTAGLVKLPQEYASVNHVSYFRDAEHVSGLDWGAWAVGIEQWESRFYISFLVHFRYEI